MRRCVALVKMKILGQWTGATEGFGVSVITCFVGGPEVKWRTQAAVIG